MSADREILSAIDKVTVSTASQADKGAEYNNLLTQIVETSSPATLVPNFQAYLDTIIDDALGTVASRPILDRFGSEILDKITNEEQRMTIADYAVQKLEPRIHYFEEQDSVIRDKLALLYEKEGDHLKAAQILQAVKIESSQRPIKDEDKLALYIRIMRNLLEVDETVTAETYMNRAQSLIHKAIDPTHVILFNMCQARILDSKRQFLNASQKYHMLSLNSKIDLEERAILLQNAMTCAILAPAGPMRSRALATLYKDDRTEEHHDLRIMLEKMYLDRLVSPTEVSEFAKTLKPHQLAKLGDGSTVLAKAVIEHNLLGASKIYNNIGTTDLGLLLALSADEAEKAAATMIEQGRLKGLIDGVEKIIYFDKGAEVDPFGGQPVVAGGEKRGGVMTDDWGLELKKWDERIWGVAQTVENIVGQLTHEHPEFVQKHLVL
ncbi:hypothetical protein BJ508DRAFT_418322 [Ascobolus immersus RN42]|uniref:COP9 signalosome complex subunit 4 n=1 Tax=Ascobolus immersus RN42 TaxID=1160509 RepID=A0A3N4HMG9_ASCIM|nr:hypothetical protein BJ508DRAFT_418322 [Ascobolus immersus RN42]